MVLREVLRNGAQRLMEGGIPSPRFAAELLLMHTLNCGRAELYSRPERKISLNLAERYSAFISERLTGKPTQYITGHQEFWGLDFEVTPDVLIPRPETEGLVEVVLDFVAARNAEPRIVDVGTGSGCIALALASELPGAEIDAIDISPAALRVAQRNAARLGLAHRVRFREDNLLTGFLAETERAFDFIVSNPPYVGVGELDQVQSEVKEFEPQLAWGGLEHGDEVYRRLFPQALRLLKPGGYVAVEIGYRQREAVVRLLGPEWTGIEVRPDLAGIARVVIARNGL